MLKPMRNTALFADGAGDFDRVGLDDVSLDDLLLVTSDGTRGGDDGDDYLERHVADSGADPFALLRDQRMRSALVEAITSLR